MNKVFNSREFGKILSNNGFVLERIKGSHLIYKRAGETAVITPNKLNRMICERLIKEHMLVI